MHFHMNFFSVETVHVLFLNGTVSSNGEGVVDMVSGHMCALCRRGGGGSPCGDVREH